MAGGLALALSGGGARGAFQVGVLDELIRVRKVEFETAAGTSTGAIQAAGVVQDDITRLHDFWSELTGNSSIYRRRGGTIWPIITGKDSLYNPAPLKRLLHEMIDEEAVRTSRKNLRIAAVNLATSELRILTEKDRNIADWVYASSAQPPFFPPYETRGATGRIEQWVDGGVRDVIPLNAALTERPRAVLVVRAEAPLPPSSKRFDTLVEIGLQSVELQTREVGNSDIGHVDLMNRLLAAEPPRDCRRPFGLSYAAMAVSSSMA
ncbi:patatin-like phospholipase family protein [Qipengyuania sp. ASV99]|uniref:patatin-like phospholipase family protein n=1 Tax=Qipengyuania sp. ASV99 TaxID=3399681 RepID=UPI003A4C7209